jgi:ABC-type cobalamin/Fe3+-siderophores transport system ATPase subunit
MPIDPSKDRVVVALSIHAPIVVISLDEPDTALTYALMIATMALLERTKNRTS